MTKKEKKALQGGPRPATADAGGHHHHIHCTGCGAHLDDEQFEGADPEAVWLNCDHGSTFASCAVCADKTRELLAEHDRTGEPVKSASLWH